MLSAASSCHSKLETNSKDSVALPKLSRQQTPPVMCVSRTLTPRGGPHTTPGAACGLCTSSCDLHWQQVRPWHQLPRPNSVSRQAEHQLNISLPVFCLASCTTWPLPDTLHPRHGAQIPAMQQDVVPALCIHPYPATWQLGSPRGVQVSPSRTGSHTYGRT